ncbi:hypothetical protein AB0B92_16440 [Streptomyces hygroscopicus]|uniref:hypothetical protein n=1 Tax=Streptomyces hygroscopicus TaxID=1912 RepID=UPI0033D6C678
MRLGRTGEITVCRHGTLTVHLRAAGLGTIADLGFVGLGDSDPDADPGGDQAATRLPGSGP